MDGKKLLAQINKEYEELDKLEKCDVFDFYHKFFDQILEELTDVIRKNDSNS